MNQALKEGVAPNQNVTWETATQKNIGFDLQFLNGDLAFTIDYFYNKRSDILWKRNASVPSTSGLVLPDEGGNLAASKIRNLECPNYEICLIDYGCGKFNRKIHIMEQYP